MKLPPISVCFFFLHINARFDMMEWYCQAEFLGMSLIRVDSCCALSALTIEVDFCSYTLSAIAAPPKIIRDNRILSRNTSGKLSNTVRIQMRIASTLWSLQSTTLIISKGSSVMKNINNLKENCQIDIQILKFSCIAGIHHISVIVRNKNMSHSVSAIRHIFLSRRSTSDNLSVTPDSLSTFLDSVYLL